MEFESLNPETMHRLKSLILYRVLTLLIFSSVLVLSACSGKKLNVLIIGDSISYGYAPAVKWHLRKVADVQRIPGNGQHTKNGLNKIDEWLGNEDWDLILFNWGLWDLGYRIPDSVKVGKKDKYSGQQETKLETYAENLDSLVNIMKKTGAKLVFVTSTYVPKDEPGIFTDDVPVYNAAAIEVMNRHAVDVIDIYDFSHKIHEKHGKGQNNAHFTKKGYKLMGKNISEYLLKEIEITN